MATVESTVCHPCKSCKKLLTLYRQRVRSAYDAKIDISWLTEVGGAVVGCKGHFIH